MGSTPHQGTKIPHLSHYGQKNPKIKYIKVKKKKEETSLVVQWLGLLECNAGGLGLIPMLQHKSYMLQKKIKDPAGHN